jgi:hypothetical protein
MNRKNSMSLNLNKLANVRKLENGVVQARCPACAEGGRDATGNHLRIQADGRFGCCVHPKDKEHRKRIFSLVGCKLHLPPEKSFMVRMAKVAAIESKSVRSTLTGFAAGTAGTAKAEVETIIEGDLSLAAYPNGAFGTPISNPYTYEKKFSHIYKGCEKAVPLGITESGEEKPETGAVAADKPPVKLPYLTAGGTLVIPFDAPERYHWWKPDGERLSVADTLQEVKERMNCATEF